MPETGWISSIKASGSGEGTGNEFVEITVRANEDLSNFTLSFYEGDGTLEPGATSGSTNASEGSTFFPGQAEITLQEIFDAVGGVGGSVGSSITGDPGLDMFVVVHPESPLFWLIQIPFTGAAADTLTASVGVVALTNTSTGQIQAYDIQNGGPVTATAPTEGAASGATLLSTEYINASFYNDGTVYFDGATRGTSELPCFVSGTIISTKTGPVSVEDLVVGDLVQTMDNGYQPIRLIASKSLSPTDLMINPKLEPICIKVGTLGCGIPKQDLFVSRQHRVLIRSIIAQRMFGTNEVLVPAVHLLALDNVESVDTSNDGVKYFHILFDQHEIVFSNGAPTESLFTGPGALKAVSKAAREEILEIFPEICTPEFEPRPARHIPSTGKLARKLIARLKANDKPLVGDLVA